MLSEQEIEKLVSDMMRQMVAGDNVSKLPKKCFYNDMNDCIEAASKAQKELAKMGMESRKKLIAAIRKTAIDHAEELAKMAFEETGFGSVAHKTAKHILAAEKTPGVEDLEVKAFTGDDGLTLVFPAPFGVIGSIAPSTNPVATVINNSISMISGGNTVVFSPHPAAKKCSAKAIELINEALLAAGSPAPLLYATTEPTMESSGILMNHAKIRLLAVTGGEGIVKTAMKTGKKVIGAGPGNPPVIVDETAIIADAAKNIVDGASFENNITCIAEKETFVVKTVGNELVAAMVKQGCQFIDQEEAAKLLKTVLVNKDGKWVINKKFVGHPASFLLESAGIPVKVEDPRLIVTICQKDHPFVQVEMMMPVMPVVYVEDVDQAIELAVEAEHGNHHSAHMHSTNVFNMSKAEAALDTTIFVKNGPSYAGIGFGGEGYATFTIATPTGEGLTSAKSFVRTRRCTLRGAFSML